MPRRLQLLRTWITSRFTQTVGVYAFANMVSAAVPFLLLPVLTAHLDPWEYGKVAMFQVLIGVCAAFTGLSVQNAVARRFYDLDHAAFQAYVGSCLHVLLLSAAAVGGALWLLQNAILRWTGVAPEWLWLVLAVAVAQFVTRITLTIWQVRVRPWRYASFQIGIAAVNAGLTLVLVVGAHLGWQGRVQAQLGAYAVFAVLGLWVLLRAGFLRWRPDPVMLRHAVRFSAPLLPSALGGLVITMTDRTLVQNMIGAEATGLYVVGLQIGMVIALLQDSFHRGWLPWFCAQIQRGVPEQDRRIVQLIYGYDAAILCLAVLLGVAAPWAYTLWIDASYAAGSDCVLWIALGYAFNGMYKIRSGYLFYHSKTQLLALVTVVSAAVNVVASWLLIGINGMVGAAQGTMLAYATGFALTWWLAARVHPSPWRTLALP